MATLSPDVETMYQAVQRTWPDAFTLAANEPCDTGADFGTFDLMRDGGDAGPPAAGRGPAVRHRAVRATREDVPHRVAHRPHRPRDGARRLGRRLPGRRRTRCPASRWVNFSLTDAAFHQGGPYSEIARASIHDTDARLGEVLAAVERRGVFDRTAFFLVADHGMEESNPEVTGDWGAGARRHRHPLPRRGLHVDLHRRHLTAASPSLV